ncbi:hypothetical protein G9A89_015194 [Geosiphon pyriformis]|nr:hypothetical protein G9A89_015194 [Geosiphon pyriformis]
MSNYSYLPQQSEEHFKAHNKNDLDFIELNPLLSCLICFPIEKQSTKTYTAYTIYYFEQTYFEDNFEGRNNSINQLLYFATFEQQPPDFEYLNHQIHIWIAVHQSTETLFETKEESYQTAPVFDLFSNPLQQNILIALQDIQTALGQRNNTPLLLFRGDSQDPIEWLDDFKKAATANQYDDEYKFQIVGGYLQGSLATWFSQETDANAHQRIIRWMSANARENNTFFTIQFENKFKTPILISKWHMELERRTQDPGEVMTEYVKAIRKLIKRVDSGRNWTEEQKIYSFTKGLRTDLSYALWPLLALKDNSTMDMAIELIQKIEDNQRMHLGSTLPVFAPAPAMATAPQMAATSFAAQTQDPNEQLIDRLTANFAWLLEPLAQAGESASQLEENPFYAFNLTDDDHDMDELAINILEPTRKKKKAKVDFILNPNKASTFATNNNEPPKAKVFKNSPKLEPLEIVQKFGPYSVVKDLIETPAHITFGQLMTHPQFRKDLHKFLILKKKTPKTNKCFRQAGLADNSNVTPLICKAQVAGYFINLILDSELSVSVIVKHFLKAISRKIDEPSTKPMTNIHGDKKKELGIAKAVPVHINGISIETDMEVSEAKKYTIIVNNKWLKKAKALLDYELCKLTIRCGKKPIVVKLSKQNQKEEQLDESDDEESDEEEEQEEQEKTAKLTYTTFTSNNKPLDNVKADKKGIIVNGKLICWPYYDILKRTFERKPGKKAKYSFWWHRPCV